ncbi:MAG: radical SAM protein [Planctomycetota bacterium]
MSDPRVLLVSPNREASPELIPPLAAAHLAGALRPAGIETDLVDFMIEDDPEAALRAALESLRPDLVGLTVRNIDNTSWPESVSFLPALERVAAILREHGAPVVVGGSGASISPEALLDRIGLDVCLVGEGEACFPDLVRAVVAGDEPADIPGVVYRTADGFRSVPRGGGAETASLPRPDYSILSLEHYRAEGGVLGVQTKRGCPFHCSYCVYPAIEGRAVRDFDPDRIASEVAALSDRWGIERVFFVDSVFNNPASHALSIARAMGKLPRPVRYGCYVSPRHFDRELAEALVASGCEGVEFGTDSLSDPVLESFGKPFRFEAVRAAAEACRAAGLPQCHHLIFGAPGETPETVEQNLARAEELAPDAIIGMIGLRVFAGTPLARAVLGEDVTDAELLDPRHHVAPEVADFLPDRLRTHVEAHAGWVLPGLKHNCDARLFQRIRDTGFRGPPWTLLRRIAL